MPWSRLWRGSQVLVLLLSCLFVISFLLPLHCLLDGVNRCDNHAARHVSGGTSTGGQDGSRAKALLAASPNSDAREGIPNILVTTRTDPRFHMFVYPPKVDGLISRRIIRTGVYEGGTTTLVMDLLPKLLIEVDGHGDDSGNTATSASTTSCDVNLVVDMGSNLGYYSLLSASRGYDVVSFEAAPDAARLQRSSVALNGLSPVATKLQSQPPRRENGTLLGSLLLIEKGVSDVPSTGRMARHNASPGMTSFAKSSEFDLHPGQNGSDLDADIELVRAGDVLDKLGLRSDSQADNGASTAGASDVCYRLLKIDVEGYELKALKGLWRDVSASYPFEVIVMEYFPSMLKSAGVSDPMDVLRYIADHGYEFHIIDKGSGSLSKVDDLEKDDRVRRVEKPDKHVNLLAKRLV